MRGYEVMTIHRPDLAEDDVEAKVGEIESLLVDKGASVTGRDLWGKRRFAYEIDHLSEGYYSVLSFDADPEAIDAVDRVLSLADEVMRRGKCRRVVAEGHASDRDGPARAAVLGDRPGRQTLGGGDSDRRDRALAAVGDRHGEQDGAIRRRFRRQPGLRAPGTGCQGELWPGRSPLLIRSEH